MENHDLEHAVSIALPVMVIPDARGMWWIEDANGAIPRETIAKALNAYPSHKLLVGEIESWRRLHNQDIDLILRFKMKNALLVAALEEIAGAVGDASMYDEVSLQMACVGAGGIASEALAAFNSPDPAKRPHSESGP